MAHRTLGDHNEHARRFAKLDRPNYSSAQFVALVGEPGDDDNNNNTDPAVILPRREETMSSGTETKGGNFDFMEAYSLLLKEQSHLVQGYASHKKENDAKEKEIDALKKALAAAKGSAGGSPPRGQKSEATPSSPETSAGSQSSTAAVIVVKERAKQPTAETVLLKEKTKQLFTGALEALDQDDIGYETAKAFLAAAKKGKDGLNSSFEVNISIESSTDTANAQGVLDVAHESVAKLFAKAVIGSFVVSEAPSAEGFLDTALLAESWKTFWANVNAFHGDEEISLS